MYTALWVEARYFQIDRLVNWLEGRRYLHAVKIRRESILTHGVDAPYETTRTGVEVESHPLLTTQKVYICPQGIGRHQIPTDCGRACERARGDAAPEYGDEMVIKTLVVCKKVLVDHTCCVG